MLKTDTAFGARELATGMVGMLFAAVLFLAGSYAIAYGMAHAASPSKAQATSWDPGSSSIYNPEQIPSAYRGEWAPTTADCRDRERTSGLYVYAQGVDTYETGGRLQQVTRDGPERSIRLKFAYEGEGAFWDSEEVWTISPNGKQLSITREIDKAKTATQLVRCK